MFIARAFTPTGLSYGVVKDDVFHTMRGGPFDPVDLGGSRRYPLPDVRLAAPVDPPSILVVLGGFMRPPEMDDPAMLGDFVQPPGSVRPDAELRLFPKIVVDPRGPEDEIVKPDDLPGDVILEPELAIVIGHRVHAVSVDEALKAVLGFTVFTDVTSGNFLSTPYGVTPARMADFFQAKCADTFASTGPWIRTDLTEADIDAGLAMIGRIDGDVRITGNTRNLKFGISQVVSFASRYRTLRPGDLISLGTPAEPPSVPPGSTMEAEIEGIGILRNTLRRAETSDTVQDR